MIGVKYRMQIKEVIQPAKPLTADQQRLKSLKDRVKQGQQALKREREAQQRRKALAQLRALPAQ